MKTIPSILAAVSLPLVGLTSLQAQTPTPAPALFGITFISNDLVKVDPATGVATPIGSLGETVNGYGVAARNNQLYTFDPNTNRIREISRISGRVLQSIDIGVSGLQGEGDLAFRPSDGVGFLVSALDANSQPTNDFYTFDLTTGTSVRLGTTGTPIDGLAFRSDGVLFAIGQADGMLYTVNTSNGTLTPVGSLGLGLGSLIAGMGFGPNDVLYAALDDRLYTVNTTTGAATPVSQTITDMGSTSVSGLAYAAGAGTVANLSARVAVGTGPSVGIGGFIVRGNAGKTVVIRGLGPSLRNVSGKLADPTIELFNVNGMSLASNDNWTDSPDADMLASLGLAPDNANESAIIRNLPDGAYTAVLSGVGATTGIGLVELYDVDAGNGARLANISSRGFVGNGDNLLIGGLIVGGSNSQRVVTRAIGPDLTANGITNALADPTLDIRDSNGQSVGTNDNFGDGGQTAELSSNGLTPGNSKDAAIILNLAPGSYTALVRGVGGTGVALVEFYNLTIDPP